jgi:peptidyl-prolyl cis-trans isomerase C
MLNARSQRAQGTPPVEVPQVNAEAQPARFHRWLREPLLQFLVAGLALFTVYQALNPASAAPSDSHRIELSADDLSQLEIAWMAQWKRPPTPEELRGLVEARVREEILYREALALGLDQEDQIVKRRMAQKMEFLAEDVAALRDPGPGELEAWYAQNPSRFALPGRVTFRHIYFSPDARGQGARDAAARALTTLAGARADSPGAAALGDRFMFQEYYADRAPDQLANVFGAAFAGAVFELEPGVWQGPVESGLGWHLVWVDGVAPGRVPAFDEVDPSAVRSEWIVDQRAELKRLTFESMRARYEVVIAAAPAKPNADAREPSAPETP